MVHRAALINALAERVGEVLPTHGYKVERDDTRLVVRAVPPTRGAGSVLVGPGMLSLMLPLPKPLRLMAFFETEARSLQEFVSTTQGNDWPAPGAEPHARVTDKEVRVWYGTEDESTACLRWRPFNRAELGL